MERFRSQYGEIELTSERESHIYRFHPELRRFKKCFADALERPDLIRQSKFDNEVLILYKSVSKNKCLAIVTKINRRNFILTAYLTNRIQHKDL